MNPIELVKKHPVITGVSVVVVIGLVLVLTSGGGDATYTESGGGGGDELSASLAMAQINASNQAKAFEISAMKEVELNKNATALTLAQLSKDLALQQGEWAFNLRETEIASEERQGNLINTLTASLKQQELENEASAVTAQYASIAAQQQTLLNMAQLNSQTQISLLKEQKKPSGLFSFLFG